MTRLENWIQAHGIMPGVFAVRAGISRAHLLRLRQGKAEPTRAIMVALADAASVMRNRPVSVIELFELTYVDEVMREAYLLVTIASRRRYR